LIPDLDLSKPAGSTPLSQGQNLSPSSENFSQDKVNGIAKPKKPSNAFEIYCSDKTDEFKEKNQDKEDFNLEAELARGWKDLPEKDKEEFQAKYEDALEQYQKDMEAYTKKKEKEEKEKEKEKAAKKSGDADTQGADTEPEGDRDHDVDMDAKEAAAEEGGDKETPSADKDAAGKKSAEKTPPVDHDEEMEEAQGDDEKAKAKDAEEETAEEGKQPQDSGSQDDDVEMVDHPDEKK